MKTRRRQSSSNLDGDALALRAARAQRWARGALTAAIGGLVVHLIGFVLVLAEMHPTGAGGFVLLILGQALVLTAPVFAALALLSRRGTDAAHVVSPALVAIVIGSLGLLWALFIAAWLSGSLREMVSETSRIGGVDGLRGLAEPLRLETQRLVRR